MQPTTALRSIALVEGAKGVIVLVAGLGLLGLVHHDVGAIAQALVREAHLNPASHLRGSSSRPAGRWTITASSSWRALPSTMR